MEFLLVFLLLSLAVEAATMKAAEHPVAQSIDDFDYDQDGRLRNHQLLYHGNEMCDGAFREAAFTRRVIKKMDGPLLSQLYATSNQNSTQSSCFVVCLERGVQKEHVIHPLQDQVLSIADPSFSRSSVMDWVQSHCQAKELGFLSYLSYDCSINWVNDKGDRIKVGMLRPGEKNTVWMGSFLGHRFELAHADTGEVVGQLEVAYHTMYSVGTQYSSVRKRDVAEQVRSTFEAEWERAHRVIRTFTEFGFSKGKLPLDLFASISAYYYNNADQATIEEWGNKGVFVNWWETDVFFLPMPQGLKRYWQSRLKKMVEAWVGTPLELTDIYGMRRYEDGARLLTHVDREKTHATSLIVNVAQGGVRKPWTIEIYDFKDRLHEIVMEPGDIVFYESARCLHGRMQPLDGGYYVNLFSHYRPVGDEAWFLKPNPPGNVPQALDIGTCTSDGVHAHCDGPYDVPYLSPKLQFLTGPEDLFKFWDETALEKTTRKPKEAGDVAGRTGEL